jgi:hypothetical protein
MDSKESYVPVEVILTLLERHLKQCSDGEQLRFYFGLSAIMGDLDIEKPTDPDPEPNEPAPSDLIARLHIKKERDSINRQRVKQGKVKFV